MKISLIGVRAIQFIAIWGSMSFLPVVARDLGLSFTMSTWAGGGIGLTVFLAADWAAERLNQ